ncbi:MAG: ABC transporter permease [Bacteroidales bacterium]|nr:ABC transporter permease [Bacteroidales bacterium]
MHYERFIAQHFHKADKKQGKSFSKPAVKVATFGIAVGLAVMIIAISVVVGFKKEVRNQVIGFGSHIQITANEFEQTYEHAPIKLANNDIEQLQQMAHIEKIQPIVIKSGIIKTDDSFRGIVLKGVDEHYDWQFFHRNMVVGDTLCPNDTCQYAIISQSTANLLSLDVGDEFITYFVDSHVRARKFYVKGIYHTSFSDYDDLYLFTSAEPLRQLLGWKNEEVSSYELLIDDFNQLEQATNKVYALLGNRFDDSGPLYSIQNIHQLTPVIFDWLAMLDANAVIILVLMLLVAGFNMISGLLILILERTNDIGLLKALGASNWPLRKVFLYHASYLVGKGMFYGNIIGMAIILLQYFTHLIPLDASIYYVDHVPVSLNFVHIILLNISTAVVSVGMMLLPSHIITKISPVKAMRFE